MKPRIIYPKRRLMERLNTPWLALPTLGLFIALSAYAYPAARLNCQDLGRCNLSTGEVFDMEAIEQAKTYATLFDEE